MQQKRRKACADKVFPPAQTGIIKAQRGDGGCKAIRFALCRLQCEFVEVKGFNWATDTKDHGDHLNTYGATKVMRAYENVLENEFKLGKSDITPTQVKNWNENANKFHSDIES